jgi:hypothetical protein
MFEQAVQRVLCSARSQRFYAQEKVKVMQHNLLAQVQAVLATTAARWQQLAEQVPAELLSREPKPGEWSAVECLQHLMDTEEWVFPKRVQALLVGQDFPDFDPDAEGRKPDLNQSPATLAAAFAQLRAQSLAELAQVTPADLSRTGRHSELGMVTMAELLHEWAAHDLMHTVQAERALMQPFIAGCGPWRPYFKDHEVEMIDQA